MNFISAVTEAHSIHAQFHFIIDQMQMNFPKTPSILQGSRQKNAGPLCVFVHYTI